MRAIPHIPGCDSTNYRAIFAEDGQNQNHIPSEKQLQPMRRGGNSGDSGKAV